MTTSPDPTSSHPPPDGTPDGDPSHDDTTPSDTAHDSTAHADTAHRDASRALPPLRWLRAVDHPELMAPTTHAALRGWAAVDPMVAEQVAVAAIDPDLADTAALTAAYGLPPETSANCVVVAGKRAGEERIAACVVLATTRADVNNAVKRLLDVRKASFLSTERATAGSAMEYGGITPVGLPQDWRVLIDARVVVAAQDAGGHPAVIIGSGIRGSKLSLPGSVLGHLPGAEVVTDLAMA